MIVVAELKKPCTDKARADFIVENNHNKGYQIKETKTKIQALDYDDTEKFENAKTAKLAELSSYAGQFDRYKCDEMYVTSSIGGYKFNADIRSQTNMQGLIDVLADETTTLYKDYDNEFRTMTKADLAVLKSECLQNGQYLYQQKWAYRAKINACTTKEELAAITFDFKMKDFANEQILSQCVSIS